MSGETQQDKLEKIVLTTGLIAAVLIVMLYWR